jgi:hypothetical protein
VLLEATDALRKVNHRSAFGQSAIRLETLSEHHPMVTQGLAAWTGSVVNELGSLKWAWSGLPLAI